MDIKALTKKRLRQQLADEKAAFESRQAVQLAQADSIAAKAEADAVAVAKAQAEDEQRRLDGMNAARIERAVQAGRHGGFGTVSERAEAMAATGITPTALAMAASDATDPRCLAADDLVVTAFGGRLIRPGGAFADAVGAMMALYADTLSTEERAAKDELDRSRKAKLDELADAHLAEYEAMRATERKMEA